MSLKSEFDREVSGISGKKGEIALFRALERAFAAAYGKRCIVSEFHGTKYQVEYEYQTVPDIHPIAKTPVRCELCDILIIVKSGCKGKRMTRYTFLQAKKSDFDVPRKGAFESSLRQHYLLSQFPVVTGVRRPIPSNILNDHITESIGSFGVFFKSGSGYDMVYSIAGNIELRDTYGDIQPIANNASHWLHRFINMSPGKQTFGAFDEMLFCANLDEFDTAINSMLVGEPLVGCLSGCPSDKKRTNDDPTSFILEIIEEMERQRDERYSADYDGAAIVETDKIGCDVILLDLR